MATHKTKVLGVDARQYTGGDTNGRELVEWLNTDMKTKRAEYLPELINVDLRLPETFELYTQDGYIDVRKGDWVILYENGKIARCNNDDFLLEFDTI